MSRLFNLFRKKQMDQRMDEEFAFHLEHLTREFQSKGLSPKDAAREARRHFGSIPAVADEHRDARGVPWLEDLIANGEAEEIHTLRISANFFRTLGIEPLMGRVFTAEEDRPAGPDAVILSYGLWQRRFGGDPQILNQTINLGGRMCTVIGVMPR